MIARRDPQVAAYDVRFDRVGLTLKPQDPAGGELVTRRTVELEENPQLDNIRPRGFITELRFTIVADATARRRDGQRETLASGRQIKRLVERAAARGGPTPTTLVFPGGEVARGSVREYTARQTRDWPVPAWELDIVFQQPRPVR